MTQSLSTFYTESGSLLTPELDGSATLASQLAPGILCPSSEPGGYRKVTMPSSV